MRSSERTAQDTLVGRSTQSVPRIPAGQLPKSPLVPVGFHQSIEVSLDWPIVVLDGKQPDSSGRKGEGRQDLVLRSFGVNAHIVDQEWSVVLLEKVR